jgi:hypothetical protein
MMLSRGLWRKTKCDLFDRPGSRQAATRGFERRFWNGFGHRAVWRRFFYDSSDDELEAFATTLDMQTICIRTPHVTAHAVRSVSEIHLVLGNITTDKISRLRLVGHSDGTSLGFAGRLGGVVESVEWRPAAGIDADILQRSRDFLQKAVKGKLENNAQMIVYGCHSGSRPYRSPDDLLQSLANTFGIPAQGFSKAIDSCVVVKVFPPSVKDVAEKAGLKDMRSTFGFFPEPSTTSRGWFPR